MVITSVVLKTISEKGS